MKINYHIGLDFGTYQSKACIYDLEKKEHEFFKFPINQSFFLASRVIELPDGTFRYGDIQEQYVSQYHYFKIAAAEDEEFLKETYENLEKNRMSYDFKEFNNCPPELLSVVFITYLLFSIKDVYKKRHEQNSVNKQGSILSRLFERQNVDTEVIFSVQLGIPTEWSQEKNLKRKKKFENILMLSELLQKKYQTLDTFLKQTKSQLIVDIKLLYKLDPFKSKEDFNTKLNQLNLSVYPETAAGLYFILESRQLDTGYYAIMDIGGGSTDISFFRIQNNQKKVFYLSSESYVMAANNIYSYYSEKIESSQELKRIEDEVKSIITDSSWSQNEKLCKALNNVDNNLKKIVYKLFNKRVFYFSQDMAKKYNNQPILLYGGGSLMPILNDGFVLIHDNGSNESITIPDAFMSKIKIDSYIKNINILSGDESWEKDIVMLVVALGLSYIKPDTSAIWLKEDCYKSKDGGSYGDNMIPHPINEGMFIYDVINSRWQL